MELNKNPYEELQAIEAEQLRVATELTQLERAETALKRRKESLLAAIRTMEDQGFLTNPNGVIKFADPELERLIAEEEHIEATTLGTHDVTTCPYCIGGIE